MTRILPKEENLKTNHTFLNQVIAIQSRLAEAKFDVTLFMQLVAKQMEALTPATGVVVELVEGDEMVYSAVTGTVASHLGLRLKIENSLSGLCIQMNQVLYSEDTEIDPRVNKVACRKVSARSMLVAPLVHDGIPIGVLKILSKNVNAFTERDLQTLQIMAGFIASGLAHQLFYNEHELLLRERTQTLLELQQAQEKLLHLAKHDSLTDLPNRSLFTEKITLAMDRVKQTKGFIALMFLDIDHFKDINDNLGHNIGDELLKAFALRLKQSLKAEDLVSRLGGDEFTILLEEINKESDAIMIAEKIIRKMNEKFKFNDKLLTITTSIGMAFYRGEDISEVEFIKHADEALYVAKEAGRNTYHIYN